MSGDDDHGGRPTIDVLGERMKNVQRDLTELKTQHTTLDVSIRAMADKLSDTIDRKITSLEAKFTPIEVHKALAEKVTKIDGNLSWGIKIVVGAVLTSAVAGGVLFAKTHGEP